MGVATLTIFIIVSMFLIILIYLQSGEVKSMGSSLVGTADIELFENKKYRGAQRWMNAITWSLVVVYLVTSILMFVYGI